ncbi:hypothetical protein F4604DRAFT_1674582 [Suillus subluteus]|nr:hypothetical protein F4604DRAFT_1674582 [Suillus subluteus]
MINLMQPVSNNLKEFMLVEHHPVPPEPTSDILRDVQFTTTVPQTTIVPSQSFIAEYPSESVLKNFVPAFLTLTDSPRDILRRASSLPVPNTMTDNLAFISKRLQLMRDRAHAWFKFDIHSSKTVTCPEYCLSINSPLYPNFSRIEQASPASHCPNPSFIRIEQASPASQCPNHGFIHIEQASPASHCPNPSFIRIEQASPASQCPNHGFIHIEQASPASHCPNPSFIRIEQASPASHSPYPTFLYAKTTSASTRTLSPANTTLKSFGTCASPMT